MMYPPRLKPSYWNDNKGKIAKAVGTTGMGQAMKVAEDAFSDIDWKAIEAAPPGQQNYTPQKWQTALDAALEACRSAKVAKAQTALTMLENCAANTVKKFNDSKIKKLIATADFTRTAEIGKLAGELRDNLAFNKMKEPIETKFNDVKKLVEAGASTYIDILKSMLTKAIKAVAGLNDVSNFNANITEASRGVHTQLSKAKIMSAGLVDVDKAEELTKASQAWAKGGFAVKDEGERHSEHDKFVKFLKEVSELVAHHK